MVQFSQLYMTTGKATVLTIQTFVGRVTSLLFNTLSGFVLAFLSRFVICFVRSMSDFMAAVTIRIDFRAQEEELCHYFPCFPFYLPWRNGAKCQDLSFLLIISFKPALSLSSFTLIKRIFRSISLSAVRVVPSTYLRLLVFLQPVLTPACDSSSLAFLMMCSAYRLNKQGDSGQPCHTPFSILNQSAVPYRILTVASWPTYRSFFLIHIYS